MMQSVDDIINQFIEKNRKGIETIHKYYVKNNNDLPINIFTEEIAIDLKKEYLTFVNKNYPIDDLDSYLFYVVNAIGKKKRILEEKKYNYLCPGCLFLGKETILTANSVFECDLCLYQFKRAKDPQWINFFNTFKKHNKSGYKCNDCGKFIPKPIDNTEEITCPYTDCCFVGNCDSLKIMHHPSNKTKIVTIPKDLLISGNFNDLEKSQSNLDLNIKVKILSNVIDNVIYGIPFKTQNLVSKHKIFVCQAFKNLLLSDTIEMVNYLLNNSRSGGFQHRVFQEYIKLLEESFPLFYQEKRKQCKIESLLDERLALFEGVSTFESIINDKLIIKNNTQEFYIGGRKAKYAQPYYIGKLLNVLDKESKTPILNYVVSYSFSKIKVKELKPFTQVIVSHLRVPPHYQMGGMVYVNRLRKYIVDKSKILLKNEKEI